MKQMKTVQKTLDDYDFYIRPFPAFTAANISGDLAAVLTPILGSLAPLLTSDKEVNVMETQVDSVVALLSDAFSRLSGDQFERLMKKLLTDNHNISVSGEATNGKPQMMTYDIANEVFCGDVQNMYILCYEVIKVNFSGFFGKLGARFGNLTETIQAKVPALSTANSTKANSET